MKRKKSEKACLLLSVAVVGLFACIAIAWWQYSVPAILLALAWYMVSRNLRNNKPDDRE